MKLSILVPIRTDQQIPADFVVQSLILEHNWSIWVMNASNLYCWLFNTFYLLLIVYDFHSGIWSAHSTFNHNLELLQLRRHLTLNYCVSKRILSLLQLLLLNIFIFSHLHHISTNPHLL